MGRQLLRTEDATVVTQPRDEHCVTRATFDVQPTMCILQHMCNVKCASHRILQKVTQIKQVLSDCTTATVSTQPRDEQRAQPRDEQCALCIVNFVAQGIAVHNSASSTR